MDRITRDRRSANMAAIKGKDTKPEMAVRKLLHARGFRFRLHVKDLPGKPDITLPRHRAVIFVHGCFWHVHDCPLGRVRPKTNAEFWADKRSRTIARDAEKIESLIESGWRVRIVWECEIEAGNYEYELCDWITSES